MLPDFLESTYKQYKNGTSISLKWMYESGQKCGYDIDLTGEVRSSSVPATAPRLKGKARKLAKQGIKEGAQAILGSEDPLIVVPSRILRAGLRAVSARKKCSDYFSSNATSGDIEMKSDNIGHSYFTERMEEVILALQPRFALDAGQNSPNKDVETATSAMESIENRFQALEVEEPEASESQTEHTTQSVAEPTFEVEKPTTNSDMIAERMFAIYCLFDDLQLLRKFVLQTWIEYAVQKVSLITASILTNAAFQLAMRTQEETLAAFPGFGDYQDVLSTLNAVYHTEGYDAQIEYGMLEFMFGQTHIMLDKFCGVLVPGEIPLMRRGHFGIYRPTAERSKMTSTEQQVEDYIVLIELLPEFAFIERGSIPMIAMDELTIGLVRMVNTKKIPIWLVFATHILLDIHHLLRENVDKGYRHLEAHANLCKLSLEGYFDLSSDVPDPSTWRKKDTEYIKEFYKNIDTLVLQDNVFDTKDEYSREIRGYPIGEEERFYLLKRHPILCGMMAFRTILETHSIGVLVCNVWGSITYTAHLYNALHQKSNPVKPWPLMDQAITIHTEAQLFLGEAPKTIEDSCKQIFLMLGYSATMFAKNRRTIKTAKLDVSKAGPRPLKNPSMLSDFFQTGLRMPISLDFTLHNVEEMLNAQARDAALASNSKSKWRCHEWALTKRLIYLQLLEALRDFIPSELEKLKFNYFEMHEQSLTVLRRVVAQFDSQLIKYMGPDYLKNESKLPFVGPYVIMIAAGSHKSAKAIGLEDEEIESVILEKSGDILNDYVDSFNRTHCLHKQKIKPQQHQRTCTQPDHCKQKQSKVVTHHHRGGYLEQRPSKSATMKEWVAVLLMTTGLLTAVIVPVALIICWLSWPPGDEQVDEENPSHLPPSERIKAEKKMIEFGVTLRGTTEGGTCEIPVLQQGRPNSSWAK
ncbi:hypothetical protein VTL71DRAFT_14127 [Oculimacula yallundae]|uniref:DUF6604 domain-containing protein n=1 Tax=Oculimacula yallundae TaxID=86028 RepID=A0ABR4CHQ4_9HELO